MLTGTSGLFIVASSVMRPRLTPLSIEDSLNRGGPRDHLGFAVSLMVTTIRGKDDPHVSVIIPSYDGFRGGNVPKLLQDLERQSFQDFEILMVKGVSPNGRARNVGVAKAKGKILVFVDDDTRILSKHLIATFVEVLRDESVGLVGASRRLPECANQFQKLASRELIRAHFPLVDKIVDSDMATHDCMGMRKQVYETVGGESNELLRGTDPDLRYRLHRAGYRVVIAPRSLIAHPLPGSIQQLAKKAFRNGIGSAWVFKHYPHLAYDTPDAHEAAAPARTPFIRRWARRLGDLVTALCQGRFIRFTYDACYIAGYLYGLLLPKKRAERRIY